ncbi:coiled-coil domain-containing protein 40 [Cydia fagiglandana]|uniref:coiled-coil domain-containing protein 40 n=1 Tax=Cydia fagiglandana TaxID=1458189 RepID=UPI002FEE2890
MSQSTSGTSRPSTPDCGCTEDKESTPRLLSPHCECPRDERDIVIHEEHCLMYKHETLIYPHVPEVCECVTPQFEDGLCKCCSCPPEQCHCRKAGREAVDEWRRNRDVGAMPAVLESTHPLMQKFQASLKQFLEKENAIAAEEILELKDKLRLSKLAYDQDLENIYRSDHDTNAQRTLIEEYEATITKNRELRIAAEKRAQESTENYKRAKEKLEQNMIAEREAIEEMEALTSLCRQLEAWREETESELTVKQRMSDKMRAEKKTMADEKRQLDMVIYGLSNEVWKLESKLEMFKKQFEIKNNEMEIINDRVTAYSTELEDLELEKRRLVALWNSVLVNISQRDKVFDSVRDDYNTLKESYRTLLNNLEITKKITMEEMGKSAELAMHKDKLLYDTGAISKLVDGEEAKRQAYEKQIQELTESIEMTERDQELITMENKAMQNILTSTEKDYAHKAELKLKLETEILQNIQDCLLNDKAVEAMAKGIKKMREISRKQEIGLVDMENAHAKVMLDIEVYRSLSARNKKVLEGVEEKVREREREIDQLEEKYSQKTMAATRKQRELDIITKKYFALKEIFDSKSPQERRIEELEMQIKGLRERTEGMQHEWLRLQSNVVKLSQQHQKVVADVHLINKQIQICDQKSMRIQADIESVAAERASVDRSLRELRGRLGVLERERKEAGERGEALKMEYDSLAIAYKAKLKDAEAEVFDLEETIESLDKEKMNLTQSLDRVQREALIWQRKGIMAVDLKKNMQNAKSAAGEVGQMRIEIHRMEVRREQLRRTAEKLSDDLALMVTRRETAIEKNRSQAALEVAHGSHGTTSQTQYHHKLRLARADVQRVTKELAEANAKMKSLQQEQARLEKETKETSALNAQLEEQVAALLRDCRAAERDKQWLLERVVRAQRLGAELGTAVKRQSLRVKKPKATVLAEYKQATELNERIRFIVAKLSREYPHLEERLETISNTLNIFEPIEMPQLCDEGGDCITSELEASDVAEKPLCP